MLESTSGRVIIQGMDNRLDIERVRHHLGFCPQYGMIKMFSFIEYIPLY